MTHRLLRRARPAGFAFAAGLAWAGLAPATVSAQAYPAKPVTVIVPFAAGGSVDSAARVVLQKVGERLKQTFIIENVAGASGTIGTLKATKSAADGYTLLFAVSSPITVSPVVKPSIVKYDPFKELVPIGVVAMSPFVLVGNPKLAANSTAELIDLAKRQPGKLNYGTDGVGTSMHLTAEIIKLRAGVDIQHVPYKSGPQVLTEVASGLLDLAVMPVVLVQPFIKDGKVKALAVTSAERWPSLPEVPALAATPALSGLVVDSWYGLFAPAGTDPAIVARLSREIAETLKDPDLVKRMADVGLKATSIEPAGFMALIRKEKDDLQAVVKAANIRPNNAFEGGLAMTVVVAALLVVVAGVAIGATSIGGVLVLPALTAVVGIDVVTAVAAASFAFLATGVLTLLDVGREREAARQVARDAPLYLAALAGAALGAIAVHLVAPGWVKLWIAVLAFVSGLHALFGKPSAAARPWPGAATLAGIGVAVGFGSGLSGTGGPILLLPMLLLLRQDLPRSVAAALVLQIPIALASTLTHLWFGRLDLRLGALVAVGLMTGAWLGRLVARRSDARRLKLATGAVLVVTGVAYAIA